MMTPFSFWKGGKSFPPFFLTKKIFPRATIDEPKPALLCSPFATPLSEDEGFFLFEESP